ncbi:hypothetical protein H6F96_01690 [Microcoleus sp. FACHB-53]|nr:hypothetical protein [Microcoleus sp. FACHB-53]MBD2125691.1 hypothetical protein [Microcoleus sp. FACHB-1]
MAFSGFDFNRYLSVAVPLVQKGRRQEAEGRSNIACTVSLIAFVNWIVISAALH